MVDMEQLMQTPVAPPAPPPPGPPLRPYTGLEVIYLDDGHGGKDNVLVVHDVKPGSPGDVAGVQSQDILAAWNGSTLDSRDIFHTCATAIHIGDIVNLNIRRGPDHLATQLIITGTSEPKLSRKVTARSTSRKR
eukprot:NODE_2749_length_648_cov_40.218698_g2276_i0.p1 GENE.NODE_2749_length_648_cov_40.218698_g2276_i0~~NODE_2749_length_648_cov_40.218698_g2276_i0.p1  ORF type:complete len:134 (+),score=24.75 NODE_2749_length_648_cov_40.218698_g2276_i0:72-473(+)